MALNGALLDQLAAAQDGLRARFPDAPPLSVNELLRWPGMLADDSLGFDEMLPAIVALVDARSKSSSPPASARATSSPT